MRMPITAAIIAAILFSAPTAEAGSLRRAAKAAREAGDSQTAALIDLKRHRKWCAQPMGSMSLAPALGYGIAATQVNRVVGEQVIDPFAAGAIGFLGSNASYLYVYRCDNSWIDGRISEIALERKLDKARADTAAAQQALAQAGKVVGATIDNRDELTPISQSLDAENRELKRELSVRNEAGQVLVLRVLELEAELASEVDAE